MNAKPNRNHSDGTASRTRGLANFKIALTALVVLHHTALSYGGVGRGYYQSSLHQQGSSIALVSLNGLNQSFFMSSFFYLSAYFSRRSLQRRTAREFIQGRIYRLGLPAIAYSLLGPTLCHVILQKWQEQRVGWSFVLDQVRNLRGISGPVWFSALLLVFDTVLALAPKPPDNQAERAPRWLNAGSTIALVTAVEVVWRIYFPIGTTFTPLNVNLGYLPAYMAAYLYGTRVGSPLDVVPPSRFLILAALASTVALCLIVGSNSDFSEELNGGPNVVAATYAAWNNVTGYVLGSSLLGLFARKCTANLSWVDAYAYSAFLVHPPVVALLGVMTDKWQATGLVKTFAIGTANIVTSWIIGFGVSKAWDGLTKSKMRAMNPTKKQD